jgi:hypothetical protein
VTFTSWPALRADTFTYLDQDATPRTVEARLAGSGQGAHALEKADGELLIVPQSVVRDRKPGDDPEPITTDGMIALLEDRFGKDVLRTQVHKPFIVGLVLAGPLEKRAETRVRGFLQKAGRFMKNVEKVFLGYATDMRFPLQDPRFPLVLLIFESDADFNSYALESTGGQGLSADNIAGFYYKINNWLAIRMAECRTFEVPLHEAIHQQMYNRVFQRLAPVPAWFDEGIATGFENDGERVDVNPARINSRYARASQDDRLLGESWVGVIEDDRSFHGDVLAGQSYVQAWCLHWMLCTRHTDAYKKYVQKLASHQPLQEHSAEHRKQEFNDVFGASVFAVQKDFPRALEAGLKRQKIRFASPPPPGVMVTNQALGEVKMKAVNRGDLGGRLTVEGSITNESPIRALTFHVAVVTDNGVYTDWVVPDLASGASAPLPGKVAAKLLPGAVGGISSTFGVRVKSVLPDSDDAGKWKRGELPVPGE